MIRNISFVLLFLLPVGILIPHINDFIFLPSSQYSDIVITHYPNGIFLQKSIRFLGEIPLWSNTILSGYPFVANPLSGLHYPPGWLALLFPLPLGFNISLIIHIILGGVGVYFLARREGLATQTALFSGLIFESLPKIYSHVGAGHLTLVYAVCWTPWLLVCEGLSYNQKILRYILPGALIGVIALADIRWTAYALIIWLFYSLRLSRLLGYGQILSIRGKINQSKEWFVRILANSAFSLCIASPLLLPLAQFIGLSTRGQLTADDNLILSLPPSQLIGLMFPNIGGPAEWIVYPGVVTIELVIFGLFVRSIRIRSRFWVGIIIVSLVLSLGSYIPYLSSIFSIPGLNLLRVPPRIIFLTGLAFSITAGISFQGLLNFRKEYENCRKNYQDLAIFALTLFTVLLAVSVWFLVQNKLARIQFGWGAVFTIIFMIIYLLWKKQKLSEKILIVLVTSACLIDLIGVNALSLVFYPASNILSQGEKTAKFLSMREDLDPYRIYSPSYSLPQQTAVHYGFELTDGIDPLQINAYTRYMQYATGVQGSGYSVTIPPFANGTPATDNRGYIPDANKLGLLNVKYAVSEYPIIKSKLTLLARVDKTWIYENPLVLPRAWMQKEENPIGENFVSVSEIRIGLNEIQLRAKGPGLLVLSEIYYPGWEVTIDDKPGQISLVGGLLRGVSLSEGIHHVSMEFRPVLFFVGLMISLLAWIFLLIIALLWKKLIS